MSATNAFEDSLLGLLFTNVAAANVGDAGGLQPSATAGVFYVSLHTASPGEAGDQTTNESAYTSYARVSVARAAAQWTVASGLVDNDAAITFPACTGGSSTVTDFGLGSASAAAGNLFMFGALAASLAISNGITPNFAAGALDVTLD